MEDTLMNEGGKLFINFSLRHANFATSAADLKD